MLTDSALLVLGKRYLARDSSGRSVETPDEMFRRVARHVSLAENAYRSGRQSEMAERFYRMMADLEFLPNSPTLMNAGRELGQLAACFVLPVYDSLDSIFDTVKETAKIHQTGGGTGFSFSHLRPKGDAVASTMGVASGPVSFIRVFNIATEVIKQGGTRRGANMGILRVDHPDIEEFVTIKTDRQELHNFNLSVAVTDRFMESFEKGDGFALVNPRTGKTTGTIDARRLFRLIAESAWESGEPGVIFLDTINRANPTPALGDMEATNPCGEQPLLPYESCCLGSINLSLLAKGGAIDWERLRELTHLAVRFLDNVIDANKYPLPEIEHISRNNRKIGLGVMGFAHMLIRCGIRYDSEEAEKLASRVMSFIAKESKGASGTLADERGPFANYNGSIWEKQGLPQRNATTTTVAPTGTLSIIAGTSSGIEPIYETRYKRVLFGDVEVEIVDPLYQEMLEKGGPMQEMLDEGEPMGEDTRALFRVAHQISPRPQLLIQKAFQDHVDNAVSKTINLPRDEGPESILGIYREAYHMGLKGITVFRDMSRESQVLSCGTQIC